MPLSIAGHVVKILRPQGREEAIIHVGFDKDTKILSMNVWSIGPDGHEYAMKDNEYRDVGLGDEDIAFADDRFRVAQAPAADPGGVIAYEYEQRERPLIYREDLVLPGAKSLTSVRALRCNFPPDTPMRRSGRTTPRQTLLTSRARAGDGK